MPGNAQTQQSSSSPSLGPSRRLGEHNTRALASTISFCATLSGPDARSQPHSHTPTSVCAVRHLLPPGMLSRRAGQALCRRSIPCSRIALLLFRLRPVEADNAWLSVSQYLIQSQSLPSTTGDGPRPMATATHLVQNCGFLSGIPWVWFSCPCWDCCSSKFDLPVPKLNSSARGAKY